MNVCVCLLRLLLRPLYLHMPCLCHIPFFSVNKGKSTSFNNSRFVDNVHICIISGALSPSSSLFLFPLQATKFILGIALRSPSAPHSHHAILRHRLLLHGRLGHPHRSRRGGIHRRQIPTQQAALQPAQSRHQSPIQRSRHGVSRRGRCRLTRRSRRSYALFRPGFASGFESFRQEKPPEAPPAS